MKITACYIVHYGLEWLKWSIRSVIDHVNDVRIFYTPYPSHGHGTNLTCPETRDQIYHSIREFIGDKVVWYDCSQRFAWEGEHRDFAVNTCYYNGADMILVVDADEIWNPEVLLSALWRAEDINASVFRINMIHYWRSVNYACADQAMPVRILKKTSTNREEYLGGRVYHMGYAQSPEIIRYKQDIHGHKSEWRPGWFDNIFMTWQPGDMDVHPTSENYWFPHIVNDFVLDKIIVDHPYKNVGVIRDRFEINT